MKYIIFIKFTAFLLPGLSLQNRAIVFSSKKYAGDTFEIHLLNATTFEAQW